MTKKRKRRKKVNFCEVRYSKRLKGTPDSALPDEVFWPVYYGTCRSGILIQLIFALRWHAIQCLEGGFEGNDASLLESRQVLIGMSDAVSLFFSRHRSVMESAAFQKRAISLNAVSADKKVGSSCDWTARAGRADLEFMWSTTKVFAEFHIRMDFSSAFLNDVLLWDGLLREKVDHKKWSPHEKRHSMNQNGDKNGLRGMMPVYALALVADCVKSELNEINTLPEASDPEWRIECLSQYQLYLARRRAAYVEAKPEIAALDEKNGHSNFGLDIDVCQLKEEII